MAPSPRSAAPAWASLRTRRARPCSTPQARCSIEYREGSEERERPALACLTLSFVTLSEFLSFVVWTLVCARACAVEIYIARVGEARGGAGADPEAPENRERGGRAGPGGQRMRQLNTVGRSVPPSRARPRRARGILVHSIVRSAFVADRFFAIPIPNPSPRRMAVPHTAHRSLELARTIQYILRSTVDPN